MLTRRPTVIMALPNPACYSCLMGEQTKGMQIDFPLSMHRRMKRASLRREEKTGRRYPMTEIIRRGIERELRAPAEEWDVPEYRAR